MARPPSSQLGLFGDPPAAKAPAAQVAAQPADPALETLAQKVPSTVYLGGSTWSYPGWAGLVYDREYSESKLAREGLAAYAKHPLLRAIGIDRTHYQPLPAEDFAAYANQVPDDFRFLVKAHEDCTLWRFPDRPRYGTRRGQGNPLFLDPVYAAERVVGPVFDGLGPKLGAILFEFAPQDLGRPEYFAADLQAFLNELPKEATYAVELRNREMLGAEYAEALRSSGACHCFNVHPRMPDLPAQRRFVDPGPKTVIRWVVGRGLSYEEAGTRFQPFDRLMREDPEGRGAIAALVRDAVAAGRETVATINNTAEGCAPLSVAELIETLGE